MTSRTSVPDRHVYVYCAVAGDPSPRPLAKLPSLPEGSAPRLVALADNISLVVADVPAKTYREDALQARLTDVDWVSRCGAAHHAVAERLAARFTVVPFRLFTLFSSEARALRTLRRSSARIQDAIDKVSGRAEWVLRIGKPDASGPKGAPARTARPASGTSFLKQKATARQIAAETAAQVRQDTQVVFDRLAAIASESSYRSVEEAPALLLDAAFLVETKKSAAFKQALETDAAGLLDAGCRVTLTGPWPPYSFVSFEAASHG